MLGSSKLLIKQIISLTGEVFITLHVYYAAISFLFIVKSKMLYIGGVAGGSPSKFKASRVYEKKSVNKVFYDS